ncbi:hypothetical protein ACFL1H_08245 [Nanoarchaeota archaeon]
MGDEYYLNGFRIDDIKKMISLNVLPSAHYGNSDKVKVKIPRSIDAVAFDIRNMKKHNFNLLLLKKNGFGYDISDKINLEQLYYLTVYEEFNNKTEPESMYFNGTVFYFEKDLWEKRVMS